MFSNLRPNSKLYILHKDATPYYEVGNVVSVSQPMPKYQADSFIPTTELLVNIVVNVDGNTLTLQKIPANADVADQGTSNGAIFLSTTKDGINSEITSLRQRSQDILNSVEYHKKLLQDYEILLQRLNPEFAEQKQQKQEIDILKTQMAEMMGSMKELIAGLKKENT